MLPSDMPLPPVASLPTFLLLTKFAYNTKKKIQMDVAGVRPSLPLRKTEGAGGGGGGVAS